MPKPSPKNVLFIFADQMHRFAMGCMGSTDAHTPHLDRLAQQGLLFRQAYTSFPVCTPYRASLLTGLYTHQTNTFSNSAPLPEGIPTMAHRLNDAGYRTSYVGKWHLGDKGNVAVAPERRGGFTDFLGYQCYNGFTHETVFFDENQTPHHFFSHRTDVTTDLAIERLRRVADQPFTLMVSYQAPHYPVQPGPTYERMYADKPIHRRPNTQDVDPYTPTQSPPSPKPVERDPNHQRYANDLDEYLRLYYAMVSQVDAGVGRLLEALDAVGRSDDTVVIFTADHGDMQGSHGLVNKQLPHEESAGVPLIVRLPGGQQGQTTDAAVGTVDFFPTLMDFTGAQPPPGLPGLSFAPLVQGHGDWPADRPVFSETAKWKMVRRGQWKLVTDPQGQTSTMLFDLEADPYEMHNRVDDPACAAVREALREQITAWLESTPPVIG